MPLQATSGAASYDAFGGGVPVVPKYIEDYFSTFLYSGTGSDQTITNNIDLSTKGGLVWLKKRTYPSGSVTSHYLMDTNRGTSAGYISSNSTDAENAFDIVSSFNTNGFDFNTPVNDSGDTYVSWSWAKAPKFFDVVTVSHTNGVADTVDLSGLGTVGCVIVKCTSASDDWYVWHRGCSAGNIIRLNLTDAQYSSTKLSVSGTTLTISSVFATGTYVVYAYAHNAGGFGLTGTDNVISCGSVSATGGTQAVVNLGYEPQWLLIKGSNITNGWSIIDNMRRFTADSGVSWLQPNTSAAEVASPTTPSVYLTSTGFKVESNESPLNGTGTYIYIAIRRGPMKVPTSGTSVFAVSTASGEPAYSPLFTAGFSDMTLHSPRVSESGNGHLITDRLRGNGVILETPYTNAENTISTYFKYDSNDGAYIPNIGYFNNTGGTSKPYALRAFRRAPSFFDEVCYTGTEVSGQTFNHNLGAVPEMMIVKARDGTTDWTVYHSALGASARIYLNLTNAANTGTAAPWNSTTPTSSVFSLGNAGATNLSGTKFVNYLFATCAGVSKCTAFTGTGTLQTINCGFTSGARFVLIKRTDSTGDWYVWDSSRGLSSSTDPYLLLNSTAAEVTSTNWVDTTSTGFQVTAASGNNVNINGASYIALAIA